MMGRGDMGNDFDPNGVTTEVIYDEKQAIREKNGKNIRYSGKNVKSGHPVNRINSVHTRVITKTSGEGEGGQEFFGSSKHPTEKLIEDQGELMESGFRRETFGPGEGRIQHNKQGVKEKKIFVNNLINEGIESTGNYDSPENAKRHKSGGRGRVESESVENQMTSKFSEVRQSLERDGLKQVTELDEEKSNEDNEFSRGDHNLNQKNIEIIGYERTESEGEEIKSEKEEKVEKKKKKDKKGGKKKKADDKPKKKKTKKRESVVKPNLTKKASGGKGSKAGKKTGKKADKKISKETETKTKLTGNGKEITTTTTTTTTVTTTSQEKPKKPKRRESKKGPTTLDTEKMNINEPNSGDAGKVVTTEEIMHINEPANGEIIEENFEPFREFVNSEGNKVTVETIREGDKEIKITRTEVENVIMENGEIKKVIEVTEEREERIWRRQPQGQGSIEYVNGDMEDVMKIEDAGDSGKEKKEEKEKAATQENEKGVKNEEDTMNVEVTEITTEMHMNPVGGEENAKESEGADIREMIIENGGDPGSNLVTIETNVTITEESNNETKPQRRRSPPKVQQLLDQKNKKPSKKDSKKEPKKTQKRPKKTESKDKDIKGRKPVSKKRASPDKVKRQDQGSKKDKNKEHPLRKTEEKIKPKKEIRAPSRPRKRDVDTSRELEKFELDKHKDKDIRPLRFSPEKKLVFNRDKLLQSSEENIDRVFPQSKPEQRRKPKLYKPNDEKKTQKRTPSKPKRSDNEPKKSRSKPKRTAKSPNLGSSVEKEYRWKMHSDPKQGPLEYRFKNPKSKGNKGASNKQKQDPNESRNFTNETTSQLDKGTRKIYNQPANNKDVTSRYRLKEIKKPKMDGDKYTLTSGQLRRNRYRPVSAHSDNETGPDRLRRTDESPVKNSLDKPLWKGSSTVPKPFNFQHEKPEGYDQSIKFRKSPKSQSLERNQVNPVDNPTVNKKINQLLHHDPQDHRNEFTTFQNEEPLEQPTEAMKGNAQMDVHFSPDQLKKIIKVDPQFFKDIDEVKGKIKEKEYPEATRLLKDMLTRYEGRPLVEIYKLIAMLMFKTKEYPEAIKYITECLDVVADQKFPDKKRIQRGLIFNLIVVYIQLKKFNGAMALIDEMKDFPLQANKVKGNLVESQEYLDLLRGDCHLGTGDHETARPFFENYFKFLLKREITPQTVIEMLNVINKIVVCLTEEGNPETTQNFVDSVIKIFEKILRISKEKGLTEFLSKDFLETLLLDLLDIFYLKGDFPMLYTLLSKASEHKCFLEGTFVSDKQILKVVHLCIKTASILRASPNSRLRLPLVKAIHLLKYGKTLLKRIPNTEETDKLDLLLTFNQGVYHLEKEDFFKSKTLFDKCLEKYPQLMGSSDHQFFRILYNIGLSLYNLKKFQEALHFFEKIYRQLIQKNMDLLKNQLEGEQRHTASPQETDLFLRVIKILAKIYYRLGHYEDCHSVLHSYINSILEKGELPPGFFKYLTMYYLCCQRVKTADFHLLFDKVLKVTNAPEKPTHPECQHYFSLFFNMNQISLEEQDCPEHPDYKRFVKRLARKEDTPEKFISTLNLMYSKFAKKNNDEALELNIDLIKQLRQEDVSISENAQKIENFLFNFLFIIVHKLNSSNLDKKDLGRTAKLLDDIRQFKEQHKIYDKIYELLADPGYNSLYNSAQNVGHQQHQHSQVFENQPSKVLVNEESLDGTDFTLTDAPMEVAEFDPLRTFEERRYAKPESSTRKSKPRTIKEKPKSRRSGKKPMEKAKHDQIYEELILRGKVTEDDLPKATIRRSEFSKPNSSLPGLTLARDLKKIRYGNQSRNPRDSSPEFAKKNNIKRKKCVCVDDLTFKWDIMKHIDEFFSNLKSMNFLGLGGEIDQYFQRFMLLIKDKNLHWQKFRFVKQMIDFYLQCTFKRGMVNSDVTVAKNAHFPEITTIVRKTIVQTDEHGNVLNTQISDQVVDGQKNSLNGILSEGRNSQGPQSLPRPETTLGNSASTIKKQGFSVQKFNRLLESIIRENRPCIHDYKLIMVLLESFGDEVYLKTFLEFMSDRHPQLAGLILRMLILEDFDTKSAKLYSQLFKKIFKNKQFILKNSWMYSHLADLVELQDVDIDKALLNSLYIKKRYLWFADSVNEFIIRRHLSPQDVLVFKLRFSGFQSLVYLLKFSPDQGEFLVKTHLVHLKSLFPRLQKPFISRNMAKFLHDLLALFLFARPESEENLDQLESCLDQLGTHCDYVQRYKFSIILSQLGKCLFRKNIFQGALRLFTKAYYAFKGCSDKDKNAFPPFMPKTLPKNFFFNILCFITICNYHLSRLDPTIEILKTISDTKFDTDTAYVEMLLMHALLSRMTGKSEEAIDFLDKARTHMNNSAKISSSKRKIFNVFICSQMLQVLKDVKANANQIAFARRDHNQAIAIFNQDNRVL